jgi:hypothetical protein
MATTSYSTVTGAGVNQVPQLWGTRLLAQAENRTFWKKFEGPNGSSMPIIRRDDLTKQAGDTINMDIILALTGAGVTGDTNALSGNEEALKFRQTQVARREARHLGVLRAHRRWHDVADDRAVVRGYGDNGRHAGRL